MRTGGLQLLRTVKGWSTSCVIDKGQLPVGGQFERVWLLLLEFTAVFLFHLFTCRLVRVGCR